MFVRNTVVTFVFWGKYSSDFKKENCKSEFI